MKPISIYRNNKKMQLICIENCRYYIKQCNKVSPKWEVIIHSSGMWLHGKNIIFAVI